MTFGAKTERSEAIARGALTGFAEHTTTVATGVTAQVEGGPVKTSLEVGDGSVEHLGFARLDLPPLPAARVEDGCRAMQQGVKTATAAFESRFLVRVPFEVEVEATARVTVSAISKTTQNEGRVSLQTRSGPQGQ